MRNVEKSNIFDREPFTIELPKTVTKLSKPRKKQNKVKIDTESKLADRTLKLDFVEDILSFKNV